MNLSARRRPLVLAYHAVSTSWHSPLAVAEQLLRSQMALLQRRGYVGLTAFEAERRRAEGTLPARSVVITFDDGFQSVLRAKPILDEFGYPGTVFVVTQFVESGDPLSWPGLDLLAAGAERSELTPLSWDELVALRVGGWEIGSHTVTHALSTDLDDAALDGEFRDSRLLLERRLGAAATLAYPYGRADRRVAAAAERAGYAAAFTLETVHRHDEPHRRPRIAMPHLDRPGRLALRLSTAGRLVTRSPAAHGLSRLRRATRSRPPWLPPVPADDPAPPT